MGDKRVAAVRQEAAQDSAPVASTKKDTIKIHFCKRFSGLTSKKGKKKKFPMAV